MKILHVIPYFYPARRYGGTPEAVRDLAFAQAMLGHTVDVWTTQAGVADPHSAPVVYKQDGAAITVTYLPNRLPLLADRVKFFTPVFSPEGMNDLRQGRWQVVHLHEGNIHGHGTVTRMAKASGATVVLQPHGSLDPPVHRGWRRWAHALWNPLARRGWFDSLDAYVCLCRAEYEQFRRCGIADDRIHTIPYGMPRIGMDDAEPHSLIPRNPELPLWVNVGRLSSCKGVGTVLRVWLRLWSEGERFRGLFCGPDEDCLHDIERMCTREQVPFTRGHVAPEAGLYWLDAVPRKDIVQVYRDADCTVCPSPYESFGLVPIESMLAGTPVLMTTAYGCLEHLTVSGLHALPPGDEAAFVSALKRKVYESVSVPDPQRLLLPWSAIAQRHLDLYAHLNQARD